MKLKIKDQLPDTEVFQLVDGEPQKNKLREIIGNGKIILFGLPGAFTSTCSKLHLPGFVANADKIKAKGIEQIFCLSVNDPYVMNYLAYGWLDRNYKIEEAISMLEKAYQQKKDDPYIIDSVGWGYYLTKNFINAEKFLQRAIKLMPRDPIVNDHYGDVLWKLNRKIQARYYWKSAFESNYADDELKIKISGKLLNGL